MQQSRYKIHTVSERTGLSAELLRAWETRHRLLRPERTPGGHRLYTDDDLRVLDIIRQRIERGETIGEIAADGRDALLADATRHTARALALADSDLSALADLLVLAAANIDSDACRTAIDAALARVSPATAIDSAFAPALVRIGEQWARGTCTVAGEHLVSGQLVDRLRRLIDAAVPGSSAKRALAACVPGERHELGLLVASLATCRAGYRVVLLGGDVPLRDLDAAIAQLSPACVLLSSTIADNLAPHCAELVPLVRKWASRSAIVAGGSGFTDPDRQKLRRAGARVWQPGTDLADLLA